MFQLFNFHVCRFWSGFACGFFIVWLQYNKKIRPDEFLCVFFPDDESDPVHSVSLSFRLFSRSEILDRHSRQCISLRRICASSRHTLHDTPSVFASMLFSAFPHTSMFHPSKSVPRRIHKEKSVIFRSQPYITPPRFSFLNGWNALVYLAGREYCKCKNKF